MIKKYCIVLVCLLLLIMAMPIKLLTVFAMEGAKTEIPFTIEKVPGTAVIEAVGDHPLPEVTEFADVSSGKFEIYYTEPGDYCYTIYQKAGTWNDVIYDEKVYTLLVSVFVDENDGLYTVLTVSVDGNTHKPDRIVFTNIVSDSPPVDPPVPPSVDPPSDPPIPPDIPPPVNPPSNPPVPPDITSPINPPSVFPGELSDFSAGAPLNGIGDAIPFDPDNSSCINASADPSDGSQLTQIGQLRRPVPIILGIDILLLGTGIMLRRKEPKEHE